MGMRDEVQLKLGFRGGLKWMRLGRAGRPVPPVPGVSVPVGTETCLTRNRKLA